jgi:hypothetical protein
MTTLSAPLPRSSTIRRSTGGSARGTGPFRTMSWMFPLDSISVVLLQENVHGELLGPNCDLGSVESIGKNNY